MNKARSDKESLVYFADLRANPRLNMLDKIDALMRSVAIEECSAKGDLTAIKLHFGESGNTSYISPVFVARVVENIKKTGALCFLTDTNTLYAGARGNSPSHIECAIRNGFAFPVVGAPVIIAGGLRGNCATEVEVNGNCYGRVKIAREITSANSMVVLTHFKCHEMTGFGGALKNVGMGCATREGKLAQHSNCAPVVEPQACTACGDCSASCPTDAIEVGRVAFIHEDKCIGCAHCISVCPEATIKVVWNETTNALMEKMIDHVAGALKGKEGRVVFLNFLTQISPLCDCYGHNDAPIVADIGILASTDPVAVDQASADMVNAREGLKHSALTSGLEAGGDKFRGVHPQVDWTVQLEKAEQMGLGRRRYRIKDINII